MPENDVWVGESGLPEVKPKVARKRGRPRSKAKVTVKVNGKTYKGLTTESSGTMIRLVQLNGYVSINLASGVVVEVAGVPAPTPVPITTGGPKISGSGASAFNARRNGSLEGLMTLPGSYES